MATKSTKKTSRAVKVIAGGAALATAVASAGYYFYGTARAKKHRQSASRWAKGLQKDVLKQAQTLKKLDAKSISKIIDEASKAYHSARGVDMKHVQEAAKELKRNWKNIEREIAPSKQVKKAVASVKKSASSVATSAKKTVPSKAVKNVKKEVRRVVKTARKTVKKVTR